ncbi:MAG: DUF1800 domain-containing protein [Hellea sp.]|nr:DUF1800 domain-containing protein [Hellea sp.]
MESIETFIATNRFGLGPAPGEAERVASDPRGWIHNQIDRRPKTPKALSGFRDSDDIIVDIFDNRDDAPARKKNIRRALRQDYVDELIARARHMISTPKPFAERMVMFWSNHFTVSSTKGIITPAIPAYEREAIRPNIFGKFEDMLIDVVRHPVMLTYLDNQLSVGPNSIAGMRRKFRTGTPTLMNENLAREVLELHTLGVKGGYVQDDVVALAKALTGWSHGAILAGLDNDRLHGKFDFKKYMHEPNSKRVLGKRYRDSGKKTGVKILKDLARHPSTARHIATKLVRHFVADDPPLEVVYDIASIYLDNKGDLKEVSKALIDHPAVWAEPTPKVKSHYELMISAFRVLGMTDANPVNFVEPLREFGQVPFSAPSPAGWPDQASKWIAPESLMRRVEWLRKFAGMTPGGIRPDKFLDDVIGPVAGDDTRLWASRAPSTDVALGLILACPEFQRR